MNKARQGRFITFEGIEGVGKSTQIAKVAEALRATGVEVVQTKEPGGTELGVILRQLMLDRSQSFASTWTEVLLFFADRLEHVAKVVQPALAEGIIVLCDRYVDSTMAYQVGGRQLERARIEHLMSWVPLMPDQTILLDMDPEEGLKRASRRAELDRFEQEEIEFHYRVRAMYLELAKVHSDRIQVVPVSGLGVEEVFEKVFSLV